MQAGDHDETRILEFSEMFNGLRRLGGGATLIQPVESNAQAGAFAY